MSIEATYLYHEHRGNIFILRPSSYPPHDTEYRRENFVPATNPTQIFAPPFHNLICASTVRGNDQQDAPSSHYSFPINFHCTHRKPV